MKQLMVSKKRIEILATNGKKIVRLFWFQNIRGRGIYASIIDSPGNLHFSYHLDGTAHTKIDPKFTKIKGQTSWNEKGYAPMGINGPPLDNFKGHFPFMQGGLSLNEIFFDKFRSYTLKRVDKAIFLDNRSIGKKEKSFGYFFELIEADNYKLLYERIDSYHKFITADKKQVCEHHLFLDQNPWLVIHIYYYPSI